MKTLSEEKKDIVGSMFIDNLFKAILIKVDDIMQNNERVIADAVQMQKFQIS